MHEWVHVHKHSTKCQDEHRTVHVQKGTKEERD